MQLNTNTFDTKAGKIHGVHKVLSQFKKISLCFECHSRVRGLFSFFLKNIAKHFYNLTHKNIVKHIENLPQHLLKKIIGDHLSITDIA